MAFFPGSPMPKNLKRETANEVDDSPSIYNARDYNIHHREIRAIQRLLVGDGVGEPDNGMLGAIIEALNALKAMTNGGLLSQYCGVVLPSEFVPIPNQILNTKTGDTLLASDTTIPVVSTEGFPRSGFLTKFNNTNAVTALGAKNYTFGKSIMNYEIIRYAGKTESSFVGCTRAVDGEAQTLVDPYAVILGGKASIVFSHDLWKIDATKHPIQLYIEHDARLKLGGAVLDSNLAEINSILQISYALSVAGSFENINFSQNVA